MLKLIGPHIIRVTQPGLDWSKIAPIIKALDTVEPFLVARPEAIRIFRHFFANQDWSRSAEDIAGELLGALGGYRHPKLLAEVVFNEVRYVSWEKLRRIVEILEAAGVHCCGPCWSSGNFDAGDWLEGRQNLWGGLSAITVHGYWAGAPTRFNALLFNDFWNPIDPPVTIGECGRDRVRDGDANIDDGWIGKGGWRNDGILPGDYLSELINYDAELQKLPYVLGAALYTAGAYGEMGAETYNPSQTPYGVDELIPLILASTSEIPSNPGAIKKSLITGGNNMPEFRLGFKAIADDNPDEVGAPIEDEISVGHRTTQRTTKGFFEWVDGEPSRFLPYYCAIEHDAASQPSPGQQLVNEARRHKGQNPYEWGDKSVEDDPGLDCSGFLHYLYAAVLGVEIGWGTWYQLQYCRVSGQQVDFADLQAGDIVFWDDNPAAVTPSHVGLATDESTVIEETARTWNVTETPFVPLWRDHFHSAWRVI